MSETTPEPDETTSDETREVDFSENEANGPEDEPTDRPASFEPPA